MEKYEKWPMCLNLEKFSKYKLSPDAAAVFDWLIVKQVCFKGEPFFYQFRRIEEELRIRKDRFKVIIGDFCMKKGFLTVEAKGEAKARAKVNYFHVDFNKVIKCLADIIDKDNDPEYFKYYKGWLKAHSSKNAIVKSKSKEEVALEDYQRDYLKQDIKKLENIWNSRIDLRNKERKDGRERTHTHLPSSDDILIKLRELKSVAQWGAIEDSFIAFADEVLAGKTEVKRPLYNFLSSKKGTFKVYQHYLDFFNERYSVPVD